VSPTKCRVIFLRVNCNLLRNDNALALSLAARADYTFDIWKSFHLFTGGGRGRGRGEGKGDYTAYRVIAVGIAEPSSLPSSKISPAATTEGESREVGKTRGDSIFSMHVRSVNIGCRSSRSPRLPPLRGIFASSPNRSKSLRNLETEASVSSAESPDKIARRHFSPLASELAAKGFDSRNEVIPLAIRIDTARVGRADADGRSV